MSHHYDREDEFGFAEESHSLTKKDTRVMLDAPNDTEKISPIDYDELVLTPEDLQLLKGMRISV